jgi:hypothetical protein
MRPSSITRKAPVSVVLQQANPYGMDLAPP